MSDIISNESKYCVSSLSHPFFRKCSFILISVGLYRQADALLPGFSVFFNFHLYLLNIFCYKPSYLFLLYRFIIASEKDLGNYSCIFGDQAKIDFILAGTHHIL